MKREVRIIGAVWGARHGAGKKRPSIRLKGRSKSYTSNRQQRKFEFELFSTQDP